MDSWTMGTLWAYRSGSRERMRSLHMLRPLTFGSDSYLRGTAEAPRLRECVSVCLCVCLRVLEVARGQDCLF